MKDIYSSYNKKSDTEIKHMWDNGLITFDANVLLNLYRYSPGTRKEILKLVEKLAKKIFLTHQAGLEYSKNRFEVISEQEKTHQEFLTNICKIEDDLKSKSKHPFLPEKLQSKLTQVFSEVKLDIEKSKSYYSNLIKNDDIHDNLERLFRDKIEEGFNENKIEEIYIEGKKRFEKKIPPGFEDEKDKEGHNMFGDLILWKQIIQKAKKEKKSVLLVTDEKKKDWWWKLKNGKLLGPRYELMEEIRKEANVSFHIYSTERFIEFGLAYFKEEKNPKLLEEVKEIQEITNRPVVPFSELKIKAQFSLSEAIKKQRIKDELNTLNDKKERLLKEYRELYLSNQTPEITKRLDELYKEIENIEREITDKEFLNLNF